MQDARVLTQLNFLGFYITFFVSVFVSVFVYQVLLPSANEKYPAFTFMQGHGRDYNLSAELTPEKREWPFIRDPQRAAATAGDFVLL